MGYYINTTDTDFFLDKKHFDAVYQKMCELNNYHELKRGGSFGSNNDPDPNEKYPKNRWFSWMEYNYPETCKNLFEVLQALGFDYTLDENGNMSDIRYEYNKTGNEDYFLCCFAGFVEPESWISFEGEDGSQWRYYFNQNGEMELHNGIIEVHWKYSEKYKFGEKSQSQKEIDAYIEKYTKEREIENAANS